MKKIAVFISGPIRYVDYVRENLKVVLSGVEYSCFYHLWRDDLGNKRRANETIDVRKIMSDTTTKVFVMHEPYTMEFFRRKSQLAENGTSTINATMGMFTAINTLCKLLDSLPDKDDYTHILRLRTDCAITKLGFLKNLDLKGGIINISENKIIPTKWLSDHVFLSDRETFFHVWSFHSFEKLFLEYKKSNCLPEKYLTNKINSLGLEVKKNIINYEDYQIIRSPAEEIDLPWVKKLVSSGNIENIFVNFPKYQIKSEGINMNTSLEKNRLKTSFMDYLLFAKIYLMLDRKLPTLKRLLRGPYRFFYKKILKKEPIIYKKE